MTRFTILVAAALGVLLSVPATAQPRGRSQAGSQSAPPPAPAAAAADDDDGDGPEAKGAALFKLDDIIEVAVRLSPSIARARADREVARGTAGASRKDQSWVLSADVNYERDQIGVPADQLAPLGVVADDKLTGKVGLSRNLPTGGNVAFELGIIHDRQELNVTGEVLSQAQMTQTQCSEGVDIFCQDQASAKLTLKQPLSRGLGSEVALAPQHKADLAAAEATVKAQLAAEQMIRDLVSAYWELAYAAYVVDVRAQSLDLARKQDQLTRQEMRAGTAGQNALDQVTYEIATRDEALLTAKLDFEARSLELRRVAGLEIGRRDILVRPADPLELDNVSWNIDDVLAQSHKVNHELAAIVLEKKIADVDVAVAHDGMLPQIDLNLSGALTGTGATGSDAFSSLGNGDGFGYQVVAGLSMSFELSGAAKAAHAAATAKRHGLDIERLDRERQIDAEVVSSVKTLMSGRTRVALSDKAIAVAEDNVRAERAKFLAQTSTTFQVLQQQARLMDAQLKRGRAVADYHVAAVKLRYLSGTLLDTYRVRVRSRGERQE